MTTIKIPAVVQEALDGISPVFSGKVRVALVGAVRNVFEVKLGYARFIELIRTLMADPRIELILGDDEVDAVLCPPDGTLDSNEATMKYLRSIASVVVAGQLGKIDEIVKWFFFKDADVVLIMPLNYGDEETFAEIGSRMWRARRCPIYTYVMSEVPIAADGSRPLDDGCGIFPARVLLNLRLGVEAGYIPKSMPGDVVFNAGLTSMLRVAGGVMATRNVKMVQVGPDQPTFYAIREDPYDVWQRFGLRYEGGEGGDFQRDIVEGVAGNPSWLPEVVRYVSQWMDFSGVRDEFPQTADFTAFTFVRLLQILREKESNAVSLNCWDSVMKSLGFMYCGVNGLLFMHRIMAPCETDRLGCLACAMLEGMSVGRDPQTSCGFFADLTRFDPEKGEILGWHCGPFGCKHCRGEGPAEVRKGWIIPCLKGCAGLVDGAWGQIGQPITWAQLRPDANRRLKLVATNGTICEGQNTIGTHLWFKVRDPRRFERWTAGNPIDHHNSGMLGLNMLSDMPEVAKWFEIDYATYDNID